MYWVVMITDGTVIEFPPEIYASEERARSEARRWAWLLSARGQTDVRTPFEGRWEAGFRDVRLVPVDGMDVRGDDCWVGTHWTRDGYPDPEAIILDGRAAATDWCSSPLHDTVTPVDVDDREWSIAATFRVRGEDEYAVANLAKVIQ